ncbi:ATP-dependent Zn protease [Pseudorhizobium flavum]|uniref:ATP-dependent Zn protease n=1 Tax=Pseudorhizobium flavum TaxID=1335061 RepID=UPI002492DFE5|nr:ATP-dependent Zn protease [Pseudorhizobium flavum]
MSNGDPHISRVQQTSQSPLRRLALAAQGMTGADVERIVREARQMARRAKRPIEYVDIEDVIIGSAPKLSPDLRWRVSVHEAGHALLWTATAVGSVISVTTGQALGGDTRVEVSAEETQTEAGIMSTVACILGGRAAEMAVFGTALIGSGGSERSDLAIATAHATQLETTLGCSTSRPLLYVPTERMAHDIRFDWGLAERVHLRLETAMGVASDIVHEHKDRLLRLAKELDTRTYLEGDETRAILGVGSTA